MASERQTGVPRKGGDEHDAFSRKARQALCVFDRPGIAKAAKRSYNRRVRREPVAEDAGGE
jgi:hypothetical protein